MPEPDDHEEAASASPRLPETIATYLRLRGLAPSARGYRRRRHKRTEDDENIPFAPGRDPRGVGDVLSDLTREAGWNPQLAREDVVRAWAEVAGEDTARHTRPVAFSEGSLTVRADSTAWAKQLQLMRAHILSEIVRRFPEAGVDAVRFIGPDVPSWKWGPRTIPGRGPRDTYG
jgi:predicted nucleic acid-binding Zn ribbon protein